ncbi:MBL fold metallo-hydrolase [Hamadaea tsunoensis]|uniref:MBL fold metallo-hydrolase n=1 Tax=Hamadaea tsunoensis TaxID=53368 RepID=UPI000424A0B1|nr:MBL fold metallo-hydrolase [Hamadaea tsunoensis]
MRITWLGHSGVLVETAGVRVAADPLLRPRVNGLRWAVPMPAAVLRMAAGELAVDAVLISHLHHDHCDVRSLRLLGAPVVIVPAGAGAWLTKQGVGGVVEAGPGDLVPVRGGVLPDGPAGGEVSVTVVHAEHHGRREPWGPRALAVGHVVDGPEGSVWLAGDTALHPAMRDLPGLTGTGRLDVAAIPVWGWGPRLGPGHLDPDAAARAAALAGADVAIPVHWGTLHPFALRPVMRTRLVAPGRAFQHEMRRLGRGRAEVLPVGGEFVLSG